MAAYAALVSLMHIIDQIQLHPNPPISLNQNQIESLTEEITFLQDFLVLYPHDAWQEEAYGLESRIVDVAHAAEDIIESHIVDQIHEGNSITSVDDLYQGLHKVILDMSSIEEELMGIQIQYDRLPGRKSMLPPGSTLSPTGEIIVVGFDEVLIEIMDKLTGQQSNRQIIPIVGMGGIGKTTLALKVFVDPLTVEHFHLCAWVTISQEYNVQEILLEILLCQNNHQGMESLSQMSEADLGEKIYKNLSGRRYLIVMDDMWSTEAWDSLKLYFPDNNNGSRIMITTRLSYMAFHISGSKGFELNLLDEEKSWTLLCKTVFGEGVCPPALEKTGKDIAKNCRGLPLSIAVIGGLLVNSDGTQAHWTYVANNLNEIVVNKKDGDHFLKILSLSYIHLPVYLKPCFLYMGVFPEGSQIRVSWLIQLWVAEGFLKPIGDRSLEAVAEDYIKDLIGRNLIMVHKWGSRGNIKLCKIHDLLRDLCLREAQKNNFLCVAREHSFDTIEGINTQRRIVIHQSRQYFPQVLRGLQSASLARSLICDSEGHLPSRACRLLRVLKMANTNMSFENSRRDVYSLEAIFQLANLRYLAFTANSNLNTIFPSSMCLLWNLQTLIVKGARWQTIAPTEIWMMTQLRHVKFDILYLPDPPNSGEDFVLKNLRTLAQIGNFNCGVEVLKRIPNIKKLKISYEGADGGSQYCLHNIVHLQKLESLACFFLSGNEPSRCDLLQNITFPCSLKKLTLRGSRLHWDDMAMKLGSLPLEVLKLEEESCIGPSWEIYGGYFFRLKFLLIGDCDDLEYWRADKTSFPNLEQLVLRGLHKLEEVPLDIGDILTLRSIQLELCSDSVVKSAKAIAEEQEDFSNMDLQVRAIVSEMNDLMESLASRNFQVGIWDM